MDFRSAQKKYLALISFSFTPMEANELSGCLRGIIPGTLPRNLDPRRPRIDTMFAMFDFFSDPFPPPTL